MDDRGPPWMRSRHLFPKESSEAEFVRSIAQLYVCEVGQWMNEAISCYYLIPFQGIRDQHSPQKKHHILEGPQNITPSRVTPGPLGLRSQG